MKFLYLLMLGIVMQMGMLTAGDNFINVLELKSKPQGFSDEVWQGSQINELKDLKGDKLSSPHRVYAKIGKFQQKLVIGLQAEKAPDTQLVAAATQHGGKVYLDDCFEIFIAPANNLDDYCHFVVNSKGMKLTEKKSGETFNCPWDVTVNISSTEWEALAVLPLDRLNAGKDLEELYLKIFRASPRQGVPPAGLFSCPGGGFHDIGSFGKIIMGKSATLKRKIEFSRKKELLTGNVETNLIKSFPSVPEYDAVAARISVDNNIQFSEAGIAIRSKDDKPLAELKAISNGGWTYIQYGAAEIHKQYTTYTNKTVLNIRMTIVDSGKTVRMEWRRDEDESWQLIDTLPQNVPVFSEKIHVFSSKDGIVRDVYAQSLIDGKVLEPYQTGEVLTSPVADGAKSFRFGDPELTAAAIISVNPSEQFSQGALYLESADRKKSAWLKAISNAGWTYVQYGFNGQGQGNVTTQTKDKAIKLRIAYVPASGNFSMDWGLASEESWTSCGIFPPPAPFLPESVRVSGSNNGQITSLILNFPDQRQVRQMTKLSTVEVNRKLAGNDAEKYPALAAALIDPTIRVYPDLPLVDDIKSDYSMFMCGGERQSFQIALLPWQDVSSLKIEVDLPKVSEHIELGRVAFADISKYNYSKILGSSKVPDPIIDYRLQTIFNVEKISPLQQTAIFCTIDLPENFAPGNYNGTVKITGPGKEIMVMPLKLTVWPFSISRTPNLVMPFSDTAAAPAAYTGYLRPIPKNNRYAFEIVDEGAYFDMVSKICKDLVKHRVTTCRMSAATIPPWFIEKNINGEFSWEGKFFVKTAREMFATGIQLIVLDEFNLTMAKRLPQSEAFFKELARIINDNNWSGKIILKIADEPHMDELPNWIILAELAHKHGLKVTTACNFPEVAPKILPHLDVYLSSGVGSLKKEELLNKPHWGYFNNMTLQSSLFGARSAVWKCQAGGLDMYSYYAHNLWAFWNPGNPWDKMDSYIGLAEAFRIYPPKNLPCYYNDYKGEKIPFEVISSLRWEATTDAVIDWLYIKKIEEVIAKARIDKQNNRAAKGTELLASLVSAFSTQSERDLNWKKLSDARKKLAEFIMDGNASK